MKEFPEIKESLFCAKCGEIRDHIVHTHKCSRERCGYGGCNSVHAFVPAILKESVGAWARKLALEVIEARKKLLSPHSKRNDALIDLIGVTDELLRVGEADEGKEVK